MCFKVIANTSPTSFFRSSSDLVVGGQRERFQRLETSSTCIGFEKVCASDEVPPEEIKGSGPREREAEVEIDLDDEP